MEVKHAVTALSSLAQESRLEIFRLLIHAGPEGMPAGKIAEAVQIPANTLSFHIKELANAELVTSQKVGRSVIYAMHTENIGKLMLFLTEDCCQGNPDLCIPPSASACCSSPEEAPIATSSSKYRHDNRNTK